MKKGRHLIRYIILAISGICTYSAFAAYNRDESAVNEFQDVIATDTIAVKRNNPAEKKHEKPRYSVRKTTVENYEDLNAAPPADLKTPENVKSVVEYDANTGCYVIRTKVAGMEVSTPLMLTPAEYNDYSLRKSMQAYYHEKNNENIKTGFGLA
ncbi:MAG: hypothetical protein RR341_08375 [Bacteroidales bacterium]